MRFLFLAFVFIAMFPSEAGASCKPEWSMMKRLEQDSKSIESKISTSNYEGGKAGNEKCRLLRQYNYLRDRHNSMIKAWITCSNPSEATQNELDRHVKETNEIKDLTEKMCFAEKGF